MTKALDAPLRRRVVGRRAAPRARGARRGHRADARGPAQAVLGRQRHQPAGRLPARAPRAATRQIAGQQSDADARDERAAGGDEASRSPAARREREARGDRGGAGQGHGQGPHVRGVGRRGAARRSPPPAATTATRSATCAARAAARATSSSRSMPAPARRAARSSSRPRTPSCPRTRRWPSWTARWRRARADYAVLVVSSEGKLPARTHPLREFNGDKLFVTFDPDEGSTLALEVAYGLARARVLMARAADGGLDTAALHAEVERAQGAMEDVRRIKSAAHERDDGDRGGAPDRRRDGDQRARPPGDDRGPAGRRRQPAGRLSLRRRATPG